MKTAIVTGGTKGIGAAIVQEFHDLGMHVVICARTDNGLAKKLGPRARFFGMDVKEEDAHASAVKTALDWTGQVDIYVNCAGFSKWSPISKISQSFWDDMIGTNLEGTFWGCKAAARGLKKGGVIINVASLAGKRGSANNSVYCASKFGVVGLTQALAKELGSKGIRVNAVCPVYVKSPGLMTALKEQVAPAGGGNIARYLKDFSSNQAALKRLPSGKEVAQACVFLASDQSSAITGQSINVDCGVLPQ